MSNSSFCLQEREREQQKSLKMLSIGLVSSVVFHGIIGSSAMPLNEQPKTPKAPLEVVLVEVPKPVVEKPKPKPEIPKPLKVTPPKPKAIKPIKPIPLKANLSPNKPQVAPSPVKKVAPQTKPTVAAVLPKSPQLTQGLLTSPGGKDTVSSSFDNNFSGAPTSAIGTETQTTTAAATTGNTTGTSRVGSDQPPFNCIYACQPGYPSILDGAEGSAGVQLVVDPSGNVVSVTLVRGNNNSQINRQALLAARKMRFTNPPNGGSASVQVTVHFTIKGSDFDQQARKKREQVDQARQEEQRQQRAKLEEERKERQRQQDEERRARQQQIPQISPDANTPNSQENQE